MSFAPYARRARRIAALLLLAATCMSAVGADGGQDANNDRADNVRILDPGGAWAVRRILRRVERKLERPGCQRIFSDFVDGQGRPLQASLDDAAQTHQAFLDSTLFYDGSGHDRCRRKDTYAVARPNSRVVLVCVVQFQRIGLSNARLADAILIHETLHALGLGEDPPNSAEITHRVMARCN